MPTFPKKGVAIITILFVCVSCLLLPYQLDDAFITYRFAANIIDGHGFVFNKEGPPIEGFSSPTWLFLLSVLGWVFGVDSLPLLSVFLGCSCLIACVVLMHKIQWSATQHPWMTYLSTIALCLLPGIMFYAVAGLEVLLGLLMVLGFTAAAVGDISISFGLLCGLLSMWVRPEGGWLSVMLCILIMLQLVPRNKDHVALVCAPLVGAIPLLLWRYLVFGDWLPNTYYAKQPNYIDGITYVWGQMSSLWGGILLVGSSLALVYSDSRSKSYIVAGFSWLLAAALEGGDWMPLGRMTLPGMSLILLGVLRSISPLLLQNKRQVFFMGFLGAIFAGSAIHTTTKQYERSLWSYRTIRWDAMQLINWIGTQPISTVGLVDIGAIGFATDLEILDLAGLTDRTIAKSPGGSMKKNIDSAYIFQEKQPDLLVVRILETRPPQQHGGFEIHPTDAMSQMEGIILDSPELKEQYRLVQVRTPAYPRTPLYGMLLFIRADKTLLDESSGAERLVLTYPYDGFLDRWKMNVFLNR